MLVELRADELDCQWPAVDGRDAHSRELAEDVRERPDVVLVAVREDDRVDVVGALAQVREVREHEVDPELLRRREHQPGVDHHDPAGGLEDRHVLPDLAEAAQGQHPEAGLGCAQTALRRPWRSSAPRITAFSSSDASTIGSRSVPAGRPSMSRAALTGVGLLLVAVGAVVPGLGFAYLGLFVLWILASSAYLYRSDRKTATTDPR